MNSNFKLICIIITSILNATFVYLSIISVFPKIIIFLSLFFVCSIVLKKQLNNLSSSIYNGRHKNL